jgi:hypothetical protein
MDIRLQDQIIIIFQFKFTPLLREKVNLMLHFTFPPREQPIHQHMLEVNTYMEDGATSSKTNRLGRLIVMSLIRRARLRHSLILANNPSGSLGA